ncbi:MAG: DUF3788 family protein [Sphaerochaetaceae bacterium]|jgi:hypothetical protein
MAASKDAAIFCLRVLSRKKRKSLRDGSLCALYPMKGFFIALVVIGRKEIPEAERILLAFGGYVQSLYHTFVLQWTLADDICHGTSHPE